MTGGRGGFSTEKQLQRAQTAGTRSRKGRDPLQEVRGGQGKGEPGFREMTEGETVKLEVEKSRESKKTVK